MLTDQLLPVSAPFAATLADLPLLRFQLINLQFVVIGRLDRWIVHQHGGLQPI